MIEHLLSVFLGEKSYLSDDYIAKIAQNDVCSFINKNNEVTHGFLIANIEPKECIREYLPLDLESDDVIDTKRSDLSRKLIQVPYFDASEQLKAEFHLVSSKKVNTVLTYDCMKVVEDTRQMLHHFNVFNLLNTSFDKYHLMSYNPKSKCFSVNPKILYTHLTRTLVLSNINPEDALLVVVAHEIGHMLDDELNNKADEFVDTVNNIQLLSRKHEGSELSKRELNILRKELQKYQLMNLKFEANAWIIGLKFIPSNLKRYYKEQTEKMLYQNRIDMEMRMERIHLSLTNNF